MEVGFLLVATEVGLLAGPSKANANKILGGYGGPPAAYGGGAGAYGGGGGGGYGGGSYGNPSGGQSSWW